jgi:DNA/RNA endonuclease YhcR with UshA esterase domain
VLVVVFCRANAEEKQDVIAPSDAAKKVGDKVTLEMEVKSVGHANSGVYFLNSEANFKTEGNFTLFIDKAGVEAFKKAGIDNFEDHFKCKRVRVTGTVKLYKERPEIVLKDPNQIEVLAKK